MRFKLLLIAVLYVANLNAENLKLSLPVLYLEDNKAYAVFNIQWQNSWFNERNHDAAWIFFKSLKPDGGYHHINIAPSGHTVVATFSDKPVQLAFDVPKDGMGLFVHASERFRGDVSATLQVALEPSQFEALDNRSANFSVYGVEMVHIPQGAFQLGDPNQLDAEFGVFYKPKGDASFGGTVTLSSEPQILEVRPSGDLYYQAGEHFEGDQQGTIGASFPKGVAGFYVMKYELNEGLYADFLNSLTSEQASGRIINKESGYRERGGSLVKKDNGTNPQTWVSQKPQQPLKFASWDDTMALADWAGLRPMTEFEFTKASRGSRPAQSMEYPWGTEAKQRVQRFPHNQGEMHMLNGWVEAELDHGNKAFFAASHYWVFDLAGSLWERVVSVGHPQGRAFQGSHGDGVLGTDGNASNADWPTGESEGFGYRGGGFYGYGREYHSFNPFSPIAYRPYGAWPGAGRSHAYGTRLARSQ